MIRGLVASVLTPFSSGRVSEQALADHVARLIGEGGDGIVAADIVGEGSTLSVDEHAHVVAIAVEIAAKRVPVIAATGRMGIVTHLARVEAEMMGLNLHPERRTRAARALLGLRDACNRPTDALVAQCISPDGLRCLWMFKRLDGLHVYQHAALASETDENGSWSWWASADTGQSGPFATVEAAEQDARSTIGWLRTGGHGRCP